MTTKRIRAGTQVRVKDPIGVYYRLTNHGKSTPLIGVGGAVAPRCALDETGTIAMVVPRTALTRVLVRFPSAPKGLYFDTLELAIV